MVDYNKFDSMVDLDGLKNDIAEAKSGNVEYKDVPHGTYEVEVEKMELTESKKGDPMVTIWFRIINGEFEGSILFMNQVITKGFQIHIVNELLRSMKSGLDVDFESYSQYANLLMDIHERIDGNREFALEYGEKKGFNTFRIAEVYDLE